MIKINWNRPLVAITAWAVLSIIVAVGSLAEAHRSGCHRWHSCPSDSGSYVCGDLGYNTYCPTSAPPPPAVKATASAPPPPKRPALVTRGAVYVNSYDLRAMGVEIVKERSSWYYLGIKTLSLRLKPGSKAALLGLKRQSIVLKARPVLWEGSLYVPASALRTMGCVIDTSLLPSGVKLSCAGVRSSEVVFVKIW